MDDEFSIALAPVFFGEGIRLFDGVERRRVSPEIVEAIHSPLVTHLRYRIPKEAQHENDGRLGVRDA